MRNQEKELKSDPKSALVRVVVVIPAYNEAEVIAQVLGDFSQTDYSIVVVDDCSTDNTVEIVSQYPVTLLRHMINLGQGAALQTAFSYVYSKLKADIVVSFDSDGQHDIKSIPALISPLLTGEFEVTLGSRFIDKKSVAGMPLSKLITLKFGIFFTRISTGLKLTDTHNGLRGFSAAALRKIKISQNRMAHASEILSQIAVHKLKYCEVPVTIRYTDYSKKKGQSIFNFFNILWDLFFGRD